MRSNNRIISETFAALLCLALASCGNGTTETTTHTETQPTTVAATAEEETTEETTAESESETNEAAETLSFELVAGEQDDYGKMITYNKGTEFEESFYAYYVPYGTYKITNIGDYMTQVNVYSDEIVVTDAGWEETADADSVKLIDVGASEEMTVPKGYHIEINEPCRISLEQISSEIVEKEIEPRETTAAVEEDEVFEETRQYIEDIVKDSYPNSKVTHSKGTKQFAVDIYPEGFSIADDPIKTEEDRATWENITSQYCDICLLIYQNVESKGIDDPEITLFVISCDDPPKIALSIYNGAVISNALE